MLTWKAYKVCLVEDGKYYSCIAPEGGGRVEYPIGKIARPLQGYGPLSAFEHYPENPTYHAKHFVCYHFLKNTSNVAILECDVVESKEGMQYVPVCHYELWKDNPMIFQNGKAYSSRRPPLGTILCDEIKPVKEIWCMGNKIENIKYNLDLFISFLEDDERNSPCPT